MEPASGQLDIWQVYNAVFEINVGPSAIGR